MKPIFLTAALLAATPAMAHHPLGGDAPQTIAHGLLSGLAHPVIGLDHLAFVVLVGIAAALSGRMLAGPLAFIVATMAGTGIMLAGITLPLAELVIAASVVGLGVLLVMGRSVGASAALAVFVGAGVFHGWAYGEAVIGSTPMPIIAYLLGFGVIQLVIAAGVAQLTARALSTEGTAIQPRIAAAVCAGIGFVFLFEGVEHMILG